MTGHLPDVNVLVALTLDAHPHAKLVNRWFDHAQRPTLQVCRVVQLGFLRVLTTETMAAEGTRTNESALAFWEKLKRQRLIDFAAEPPSLDVSFASRAITGRAYPKRWGDAYLSAFSEETGLTLVTLDVSLAGYTPHSILLRP